MKITEEMIPLIEKALGFKLYDWQRAYLLEEQHSKPKERASGRTTAYIVKLLLTNHEPIDIKFHAMRYKDHQGVHYTDFFRNFMREIDEKLTTIGLHTCTVKPKSNNRTIEIEIDADTSKLQLKLRAIAKCVGALADELDAIDNGIVKDEQQMQIEKFKEIIISIGKVNGKSAEEIASALKDFTMRLEGSNWL